MVKTRSGFTLLELLLSVSMIAILTALVLPIQRSYYTKNALTLGVQSVVQAMRQAETYAKGMVNDESWGVYVAQGEVVVFAGESYIARIPEEDIVFDMQDGITASGVTEYVFTRSSGLPEVAGTVVLSNVDGKSARIEISAQGIIHTP